MDPTRAMEVLISIGNALNPTYCRVALVVVVGAVGVVKALGKVKHANSQQIGTFECIAAMLLVLPRVLLGGLGRLIACGLILNCAGAMVAVKPNALIIELVFAALAAKVLQSEWLLAPESITYQLSAADGVGGWPIIACFCLSQGLLCGTIAGVIHRLNKTHLHRSKKKV